MKLMNLILQNDIENETTMAKVVELTILAAMQSIYPNDD